MLKSMQAQMGGPWAQARNFAVITGVHAGIAAAVRRVRKKDDTYTAYATLLCNNNKSNRVSAEANLS